MTIRVDIMKASTSSFNVFKPLLFRGLTANLLTGAGPFSAKISDG